MRAESPAGSDRPGVNLLPDLRPWTADALAERIGRNRRPGDVVVVADPDQADQVDLAGDGVDLTDTGDVGDRGRDDAASARRLCGDRTTSSPAPPRT